MMYRKPPRLARGSVLSIVPLAIGALLGASLPAAAQEAEVPAAALPGTFGETIDVRVINLEIVVTDRDGNPVHGLGPEDFELTVDGQPRAIEYFTEIANGRAERAPEGSDVPSAPAVSPGEDVGTSYLLFVDDFATVQRDRNRVLESMQEDLGFIGPQDRMAVVAYDGKQVQMLSTWSQSHEELERALERATRRPAYGLQREIERNQVEPDLLISVAGGPVGFVDEFPGDSIRLVDQFGQNLGFRTRLSPQERNYASRLTDQVGSAMAAAAATMRAFARPPGRKVMLVVAGEWPLLPAEYAVGDNNLAWLYEGVSGGETLYRPLVDTANRLGYTIYPIDAPGLQALSGVSAADRTGVEAGFRANASRTREWSVESTLRFVAAATGGEALINASREHALQQVFEDTRSYYWIGFSPSNKGDNERHDVRLRTVRRDLRLRSRTDYLDLSRTAEATMAVESTLLFGLPPGTGTLKAELGEPERSGRRRMQVPVTVFLPMDEFTVLPQGEKFVTRVELRFAVQDDEGARAPIPVVPLELTLKAQPPAGAVISYETTLELRPREHDLVIGVHDPVTGRLLSTTAHVKP
ncbi:MAG: VWA domain-containing protein [Thermoanaerobaculia bacterium]